MFCSESSITWLAPVSDKEIRYFKKQTEKHEQTIVREEDLSAWIRKASRGIGVYDFSCERYCVHYLAIDLQTTISKHDTFYQIRGPALCSENMICFLQGRFKLEFHLTQEKSHSTLKKEVLNFRFAAPLLESVSSNGSDCVIIKIALKQNAVIKIKEKAERELFVDSYQLFIYENSELKCVINT